MNKEFRATNIANYFLKNVKENTSVVYPYRGYMISLAFSPSFDVLNLTSDVELAPSFNFLEKDVTSDNKKMIEAIKNILEAADTQKNLIAEAFSQEYECGIKYKCHKISTGEIYRFCRENKDNVFVYAKGKSRYGYRYNIANFLNEFKPVKIYNIDKDKKWHNKVAKVICCLNESGLWPELKEKYENLYLMTLEDKNSIASFYWSRYDNDQTVENYNKEMNKWIKKYPFIGCTDIDHYGCVSIDTFYIFEMSEARTKNMYFGKYDNQRIKEAFKQALENKTAYSSGRIQVNYDVSLEYKPEKNAAWYSEEYRNCGNGHYYLAISPSVALFCEND